MGEQGKQGEVKGEGKRVKRGKGKRGESKARQGSKARVSSSGSPFRFILIQTSMIFFL